MFSRRGRATAFSRLLFYSWTTSAKSRAPARSGSVRRDSSPLDFRDPASAEQCPPAHLRVHTPAADICVCMCTFSSETKAPQGRALCGRGEQRDEAEEAAAGVVASLSASLSAPFTILSWSSGVRSLYTSRGDIFLATHLPLPRVCTAGASRAKQGWP